MVVLVLLAGAALLAALPLGAAVVRIGPLGMLWGYALIVASPAAVAATIAALLHRSAADPASTSS